jgi:CheY-like chemotaxis protein
MARILVVEDNPLNLKLTTLLLTGDGHTVVPAVDSVEVEAALAGPPLDLIVMDVALPGTDGYTLTRTIRARPATARIPILTLSAFAMPGDAEKALEAGCTDYMTKPIQRTRFLGMVARLLRDAGVSRAGAPSPRGEGPR